MDISTYLTNAILASKKDFFVLGILGQPSAGKRTLAKSLTEQLHLHNRKAETVVADDCYYIEMMPGIRMRRSNLARDIRKFQQGTRIFIAGGDRIKPATSVLLILATFKYLPQDLPAWEALDYRLVITFRDASERLRRRIELETRRQGEGGRGRSEAEVLGDFAQEQLQELSARDLVRQADVVWIQDANQIGRFGS